jgi:hypothetical protein
MAAKTHKMRIKTEPGDYFELDLLLRAGETDSHASTFAFPNMTISRTPLFGVLSGKIRRRLLCHWNVTQSQSNCHRPVVYFEYANIRRFEKASEYDIIKN